MTAEGSPYTCLGNFSVFWWDTTLRGNQTTYLDNCLMSLPDDITLRVGQTNCLGNYPMSLPYKIPFLGEVRQLVQVTVWCVSYEPGHTLTIIHQGGRDAVNHLNHHPPKVSLYWDRVDPQPPLSPKFSLCRDGVDIQPLYSSPSLSELWIHK